MALVLAAALALGCGGGDGGKDDSAAGPEDEGAGATALDEAVFAEMQAAMLKAVGLLYLGGGTVPGKGGGQIVVAGNTFTFDRYSPDGELVLDGRLDLDLLASPIAVTGELRYSGQGEGDIAVDMTVDPTTDPVSYGGTVTIGGTVYDVAALVAEDD